MAAAAQTHMYLQSRNHAETSLHVSSWKLACRDETYDEGTAVMVTKLLLTSCVYVPRGALRGPRRTMIVPALLCRAIRLAEKQRRDENMNMSPGTNIPQCRSRSTGPNRRGNVVAVRGSIRTLGPTWEDKYLAGHRRSADHPVTYLTE